MTLTPPATPAFKDTHLEQVRREHERKIIEIQTAPLVPALVVTTQLVDGVPTKIAHKLGRKPTLVIPSVVRGALSAGLLVETARDDKHITLTASGYGATITVDLAVA